MSTSSARGVAQRLWRSTSTVTTSATAPLPGHAARRFLHASQRVYADNDEAAAGSSSKAPEPQAQTKEGAGSAPQTLDDLIGGGMDMPPSSSAFDDLFSGPNPFPRAEASQGGAGPSQYDPFHRDRAGGGRGGPRDRPPRDDRRFNAPRSRAGDSRGGGPSSGGRAIEARMSPQERDAWVRLLDDVSGAFGDSPAESSAFPAALSKEPGDSFTPMERFVHRNQLRPSDRRGSSSRSSRNAAPAEDSSLYRLASLGEKGDFSFVAEMNEPDLASAVDRAEQSMNLCSDEAELWAWAARDVFGFDQDEYSRRVRSAKLSREAAAARRVRGPKARQIEEEKAAATPPKKDPEARVDSANAMTTKRAPYGISTPLYAPVLHRLFLQLRNRFNSPHSALSLLNVVRGLGPQSLVLGYTPELLAEAVSTRWEAMRDLGGACDTLRDAKAVGTLDRRRKHSPARALPAAAGSEGGEGAEERHPVDAVVKTVSRVSEAARLDVLQARTRHMLEEADRLQLEGQEQEPLQQPQPSVAKRSKEKDGEDDFFADWLKDDDEEVPAPSEELLAPSPAPAKSTKVTQPSLPLPAIDALRIVDEMGSLAGLNRGGARRSREMAEHQGGSDRAPRRRSEGGERRAPADFVPPRSRRERDPHSSWGFSA